MHNIMEWNDLKFVLAICREGTLSGAARRLGVNHSTVFRRIGAIEEKLGVRLFERLPNGYTMTVAGEAFLATADRIEEEVISLERQLTGEDLRLSGVLRITTTDTLAHKLLPPAFSAFCRAYPGIELEVAVANTFLNLTKREADVAIRPTSKPPLHLVGRRVCSVATAIYGSVDYLKLHGDRDLASHTWLAPEESLAYLPAAKWLARHYPNASVALRSNSLVGLYEAARAGIGVVALPCFMADPDPTLQRTTQPKTEFATELWLLTHADLRGTARVHAFLEFMAQELAHHQCLLEGRRPQKRQGRGESERELEKS